MMAEKKPTTLEQSQAPDRIERNDTERTRFAGDNTDPGCQVRPPRPVASADRTYVNVAATNTPTKSLQPGDQTPEPIRSSPDLQPVRCNPIVPWAL